MSFRHLTRPQPGPPTPSVLEWIGHLRGKISAGGAAHMSGTLRQAARRMSGKISAGGASDISATVKIYSPLDIDAANLKAWLRPDAGVVTLSSGKVSALADQSGTGDSNKNLVQATGAKQATYNASDSAYNNRPTMSFGGSQLHSANWAASVAQAFTIYIVGQGSGSNNQEAFSDDSAGTLVCYQNNAGNAAMYAGVSLNTTTNVGTKSVMCFVFNGASSAIYVNDATTAKATGNASGASLVSAILGDNASASTPLTGKIADWIAYAGAHDHTKRSAVMSAYAAPRYAISVTP